MEKPIKKLLLTIEKVEQADSFGVRERLVITANGCWGTAVVFERPTRLAKSYVVGRKILVGIELFPQK